VNDGVQNSNSRHVRQQEQAGRQAQWHRANSRGEEVPWQTCKRRGQLRTSHGGAQGNVSIVLAKRRLGIRWLLADAAAVGAAPTRHRRHWIKLLQDVSSHTGELNYLLLGLLPHWRPCWRCGCRFQGGGAPSSAACRCRHKVAQLLTGRAHQLMASRAMAL
jgi:hypothetical protein